MKTFWLIAILTIWAFTIKSQVAQQLPAGITETIEQMTELAGDDVDMTALYEDLSALYIKPINLNEAEIQELEKLPFLNEFQIRSLADYRMENGPLLSVYELSYIYGFDAGFARLISPFVTTGESTYMPGLPKSLKMKKNSLLLRVQTLAETPQGYQQKNDTTDAFYKGNKLKYYARYKYESQNITAGFLAEKDAGEPFFIAPRKDGFDFYSGFVKYQASDWNLIAGDFSVCYGQGLVLWTRYATGKGIDALDVRKRNQGIHPFSSAEENIFFRGAAGEIKKGRIITTLFVSSKPIDASLIKDSTAKSYISSFQVSGLHASESQINSRKNVNHQASGASIHYAGLHYKTGLNFYTFRYNFDVATSTKPYQKFNFNGNHGSHLSTDITFYYKSITGFGEAAITDRKGYALVGGLINQINDIISVSVVLRNYSRNHTALWSQPFGENSTSQNEKGIYAGIRTAPFRNVVISGYYDQFRFPWLKSSLNQPSQGYEAATQAWWSWRKNVELYSRLSWKQLPEVNEITETFTDKILSNSHLLKFRTELRQTFADHLSLKTRFDYVKYLSDTHSDEGFYIFQDAGYTFSEIPVTISVRYGLFDTGSYDTRIYAYEQDVLYGFSVPAVSGEGSRSYLLIQYDAGRNLSFWFRVARFNYADRKIIGSGNDQIAGNTKTEIKCQVLYKF